VVDTNQFAIIMVNQKIFKLKEDETMRRKVLSTILAGAFLLFATYPIFASQIAETNKAMTDIPEIVYDTEKIPQKSFVPKKLDASTEFETLAAGNWTANCDVYNPVLSNILCNATSTSTMNGSNWAIDLIYAKVRAYEGGGLIISDEDSNTNSAFAGITVNTDREGWGVYCYGNHKFEEAGYQSWYPETFDDDID
jgi:hypothetical protein